MAMVNLAASAPTPAPIPMPAQAIEASVYGTENWNAQDLYNLTTFVDRTLLASLGCIGQSCTAADFAGATGNPARARPLGGSSLDSACVAKYNPAVANTYKSLPDGPAQDVGLSTALMAGINALWRPLVMMTGSTEKGTFDGACTPNILIFAKGTFEPGTYGVFVGPSFTSGLPSSWSTAGVSYDPDVPGDFCLGLPGGMVAKDMINQAAKKCPSSKIYLSGYSQGAMVVRNGLAYADPEAKSHVKGIVTFGDPFNGSTVKGWSGPISVFCNTGDGVCSGNFELAGSHLSYGMDTSAGLGQKALLNMAGGGGGGLLGGGGGGLFGGLFGKQ